MSFIYYKLKQTKPYHISFSNYSSVLSYKLICDNTPFEKAEYYFEYKSYLTISQMNQRKRIKTRFDLNYHPCTEDDFYNVFNFNSTEYDLHNFYCLETNNTDIFGIYPDEDWTYYEIRVQTRKNLTQEEEENAMKMVHNNECAFHIYFIENRINIYSMNQPVET